MTPVHARAIMPALLCLDRMDDGDVFAFSSRMADQLPTPDNPELQKDPEEWKTGDEPMTPAQRSYIQTLAQDTGEEVREDLTKAEASKVIDELRQRSPRLNSEDRGSR
jgi:hypothetical protein